MDMTQKSKQIFRRVKNILGIGENADYQNFMLFPKSFHKFSLLGSLKVDVVFNPLPHNPDF